MTPLIWPNSRLRICTSFKCNFKCDYCSIDYFQEDLCRTSLYDAEEKTADEWIMRLWDLKFVRPAYVILGAGEPALFDGIDRIVNCLDGKENANTALYTNASTKSIEVFKKIKPRDDLIFYISYHPKKISVEEFAANFKWIKSRFRVVDCHAVGAPSIIDELPQRASELKELGVELEKRHRYLVQRPGEYNFYDEIGESPKFRDRFASRVDGKPMKTVLCKTSYNHADSCNTMSYPVAPNGDVYTCWRYLFNKSEEGKLGNFFDESFMLSDNFFECKYYGDCNMCAWDKNIIDKETGQQLNTDVIEGQYV